MNFLRDMLDWQTDTLQRLLQATAEVLIWIVGIGVTIVVVRAAYEEISARLRRNEVARCFLHLLEIGLAQGRSLEQTVVSLSQQRVKTLGVYLHLLAGHLEKGLRFDQALDQVPQFLPAHVREMIKAGAKIGRMEKTLAICRQALQEGPTAARTSVNEAIVFFCLLPVGTYVIFLISVWVLPKFKDIAADMIGTVPVLPQMLATWSTWLVGGLLLIWLLLLGCRLYGAALLKRFDRWRSLVELTLPWTRKRAQRNFSAMLSLALDAGIAEADAVTLAARSTGNAQLIARAQQANGELARGIPLPQAVQKVDDSGEFAWRIRNVGHGSGTFMSALAGWHDALELRASQQEETVSQAVSTGLIVVNGCAVGLLAASVFLFLIAIIEHTILW